jgi:Ca2+-binding EF-hand superfamily protein
MKQILPLLLLSALAPLTAYSAAPPARPDPAVEDAHDLVVLHPSRPYRIRLHLRVGDRPFRAGWNGQVADLFRYLDADGNGVLSKAEAALAPSREQWQQLTSGSTPLDPDAAPNFSELARGKPTATQADLQAYYATSQAGPLQMRWGAQPPGSDPVSETLFKHLDTDGDGKLSRSELEAAQRVLNRLDVNEDEMISRGEIMSFPGGFIDPGPATYPSPAHGPAAGNMPFFSFHPGAPVAPLVQAILARYDRNNDGKLSPDEIKLAPSEFARLDRNRDGKLDSTELAAWVHLPADLEVHVPLGRGIGTGIRVTSGPRGKLIARPTHMGLNIILGEWCLELRGEELPGPRSQRAEMLTQVFRSLDTNSKGYLDKTDIFRPPFTFVPWLRLADRDGDGRISKKEFLAFAEIQQKVQGSLTIVRVQALGQSLFRVLDSNCDGRLGQRELRNAWKQMTLFDVSGTRTFRRETLPQHFRVILGYGTPVPFFPPRMDEAPPPSPRGPLWFRKMDRNGDGDVSRGEWLGTAEQFRAIDTDGDGLISLEEAEAYDKRMRGKTGK